MQRLLGWTEGRLSHHLIGWKETDGLQKTLESALLYRVLPNQNLDLLNKVPMLYSTGLSFFMVGYLYAVVENF